MRRFFFSLLIILLFTGPLFSQESGTQGETPSGTKKFYYQFGIGSFYSSYFPLIRTTVESMDAGSLVQFPGTIYFQFGRNMTDKLSWNTGLTTGLDSFSSQTGLFQLYTILLTGGIEFTPFPINLTVGMDLGFSLLIPNTDLSYAGTTEPGSGISLSIGYMFEALKFGKAGIVPGIKVKMIHSELFRGTVNQINIYLNLTIN